MPKLGAVNGVSRSLTKYATSPVRVASRVFCSAGDIGNST
jgi:hypothetical protein